MNAAYEAWAHDMPQSLWGMTDLQLSDVPPPSKRLVDLRARSVSKELLPTLADAFGLRLGRQLLQLD